MFNKKQLFLSISIIVFVVLSFYFNCSQNSLLGIGEAADVEKPRITVTSPNNTDLVTGTFTITGTADDDVAIDKITISASGFTTTTFKAARSWSKTLDVSAMTDGPVRFTVTISDTSGKTTTTYLNVIIDKTGPTVDIYSPDMSAPLTSLTGKVNFVGQVSDDNGVDLSSDQNQFFIYHNTVDNIVYPTNGIPIQLASSSWNISNFDTANLTEDQYTVRISYADLLGNLGVITKNISISHEPDTPTVYIKIPDPEASTPPAVSQVLNIYGYATDNNAITKVFYNIRKSDMTYVYSSFQEIATTYEYIQNIDISTWFDDVYTVVVYAVDNNSNVSPQKEARFVKDAARPSLTILDSTTSPTGLTPLISTYHKNDFTVEVKCSMSGAVVEYNVVQNTNETGWTLMTDMGSNIYRSTISLSNLISHSITDGVITVKFKATKGPIPGENNRIFYMDTTNPSATLLSHTSYQEVNGAVTLSGYADDAVGLDKIEIFNPDPAVNTWVNATGSSLWSYIVSSDTSDIETKFGITDDNTSDALFKIRATDKAGNQSTQNLHLIIAPATDKPKLVLLMPAASGMKVSGNLSILCAMDDDDYPVKDMTANITVYDGSTPVLSKNYDKNTSGFPNLSMVVDTSVLTDGNTYTIKINGSAWHTKTADEVVSTFIVDKNVPIVTLTAPVNDSYKTTTLNFTGQVKDENNVSLYLSYLNASGQNMIRDVTLTPTTPEGSKNVWNYNITLNASAPDTGLTGTDIDWSDNEWGNNPHLFTLRANDETGLIGYQYVTLNLDNHKPTVNITAPTAGYIIGWSDGGILSIKGTLDDTPPAGSSYPLSFNMIQLELWKGGVLDSIIKPYSEGSGSPNITGTPQSFTYTWNHTAKADATDYSLRMYALDTANNSATFKEVTFIKNSYPPVVNNYTWVEKNFYNGIITFHVDAQDRGTAPSNGIAKLELLIDNNVQRTYNYNPPYNPPYPLSITQDATLDTVAYNNDGIHTIAFRVTDISNITHTLSKGSLTFDNVAPVISTPTYYTMGYTPAITSYSTYLGFTVVITDTYSLAGDNPQFKLGTTSGGNDIMDWSYFSSFVWNGQQQYTASFLNYIYVFSYSGTLYLTIKSTDNAGNQKTSEFTINKSSSIPNIGLDPAEGAFISDRLDTGAGDGYTNVTGTVTSGSDQIWIRVDSGGETLVSSYSGGTTFTHSFANANLSNGTHAFRVRVSKNGHQNIVTKSFTVDNAAPTVTISSTVVEASGQGHVSADYSDLSGKVTFSGTYNDNNADYVSKAQAAISLNINGAGWVTLADTDVVKNYGGSNWTWSYTWDSETLSTMVANGITIQVRAYDKGNNSATAQMNKDIVPYIRSLTSDNTADHPVQDVKFYQNGTWANHENRRYSLAQGTQLVVNGYNLKRGSTTPTLRLGTNTLTVTGSTLHQVRATIPASDTTGKSGNLYVTTDGINSTTVTCYVWRFAMIGVNNDTLDAKGIDMNLKTDGYAFVTFTRDHQVNPYYQKTGASFSPDDYSTYRITEAASYNSGAANAYNNFGSVDPLWFTANIVFGTYSYMATCLDEWSGTNDTGVKRVNLTSTLNIQNQINPNNNAFEVSNPGTDGIDNSCINTDSNTSAGNSDEFNTNKYGSVALQDNGSGNGYLYLALYDDDSRATSPSPKLWLTTMQLTTYALPRYRQSYQITNSNNPGPWNAVDTRPDGYPVITYYTNTDNKLNMAYNISTVNPTTFTTRTALVSGGKYNSMIMSSNTNNLMNVAYQDNQLNLTYAVMNISGSNIGTDTLSTLNLETMTNDGLTGFNTSICVDDSDKPYISYINNSELNSTGALHLARFTGTVSKANLVLPANWEYMKAPSPVAVNTGKTVIRWNSTADWPVVVYKGSNYIYVGRLIQ